MTTPVENDARCSWRQSSSSVPTSKALRRPNVPLLPSRSKNRTSDPVPDPAPSTSAISRAAISEQWFWFSGTIRADICGLYAEAGQLWPP